MAVVVGGREQFHRKVFRVLRPLQRIDIQFVHFLAQHHAFAGPQRFAPLFGTEIFGFQIRLRQRIFLEVAKMLTVGSQVFQPAGEIFVLELREDALTVEKSARYDTK